VCCGAPTDSQRQCVPVPVGWGREGAVRWRHGMTRGRCRACSRPRSWRCRCMPFTSRRARPTRSACTRSMSTAVSSTSSTPGLDPLLRPAPPQHACMLRSQNQSVERKHIARGWLRAVACTHVVSVHRTAFNPYVFTVAAVSLIASAPMPSRRFNFRATKYLHENGWTKFFRWYVSCCFL